MRSADWTIIDEYYRRGNAGFSAVLESLQQAPDIAAEVTSQDQRADPQMSPWAREKNAAALAASLAKFSAAELGSVIAAALLQRLDAHEAGNVLMRADRIVRRR